MSNPAEQGSKRRKWPLYVGGAVLFGGLLYISLPENDSPGSVPVPQQPGQGEIYAGPGIGIASEPGLEQPEAAPEEFSTPDGELLLPADVESMDEESLRFLTELREKCWTTDGFPLYYPRVGENYQDTSGATYTLTERPDDGSYCVLVPTAGNPYFTGIVTAPVLQAETGRPFVTYRVFNGEESVMTGATPIGK